MSTTPDHVPTTLPAGATDCHFHVFDRRYPMLPGRDRGEATVARYETFRQDLGLSRGVIIAPSSYGYDNRCLLDSLAALGRDAFRAVVIPRKDGDCSDWPALHAQGVRGLRLYTGHADFPDAPALRRLAGRAADQGWHLQFVGEQSNEPFGTMAELLAALPCPLVFDHFGFAPQPAGVDSLTARTLTRLLDRGHCYVKLSGTYIQSKTDAPEHRDFDALGMQWVRQAPERVLWGTDWPHTLAEAPPDGLDLLASLARWAPDTNIRQKILVDNPTRLYWS